MSVQEAAGLLGFADPLDADAALPEEAPDEDVPDSDPPPFVAGEVEVDEESEPDADPSDDVLPLSEPPLAPAEPDPPFAPLLRASVR